MRIKTTLLNTTPIQTTLLLLLIITFAFSCQTKRNDTPVSTNTDDVSQKVASLLSKMTLEEKIAELGQNAPTNERLGIPIMNYSECLHGLWLKGATVYPQAIALGATWDPELLREMTTHIAKEARAANLTHCYSPNLDVSNGDPRYGRIEESYGEDPYLVSRMGVAFIQGLQGTGDEYLDKNHILATAKHFVGYPENRTGLNAGFSDMSERMLYEIYMPPFKAAVKEAKVGCIMPGHQDLNGIPLHMNQHLLDDVLRKDWGFDGFIVSDNNDVSRLHFMHQIAETRTEASLLGLRAGVDMDLVIDKKPINSAYINDLLLDTIQKNPELEKYIDRSASRILTLKYKLGLFETIDKKYPDTIASTPESQDVALKIAKKAMTLLKNDDNLLPLDPSKINSIAVIGPNAGEGSVGSGKNTIYTLLGGYSGVPPYYTSVLEGITNKVGKDVTINYAKGCDLKSFSKDGFPEAIRAAEKSDVVILAIGGSIFTCGEGFDRSDIDLYGVQNELAEAIYKTGKPVIAVLINGRPLSINYIAENYPAILETWYSGMRAGEAIAATLFGDNNPGGKLTLSFPKSVGHLPVTYLQKPDFIGSGKGKYIFSDKAPLFPFGFGLSYTSFSYSTPTIANPTIPVDGSTTVSVDVTNTGKFEGDEVVQMYIRDDYASVGRYHKMLKGFKRISLAPGETKTVTFDLNFDKLFIYDQHMKKTVEPGTFTIYVGASSLEKDLQKVQLTVQ